MNPREIHGLPETLSGNPHFDSVEFGRFFRRLFFGITIPSFIGLFAILLLAKQVEASELMRMSFDPSSFIGLNHPAIVSVGGFAFGIVAAGGVAMGVIAVGGAAVGVIAVGGGAVGVLAVGGGAVGVLAIGGGATGVFVIAGSGRGKYVLSYARQDREAAELLCRFFPSLRRAFPCGTDVLNSASDQPGQVL